MKYLSSFIITLTSSLCWGHARLTAPTPRNNNAGIKSGPCGGLARTANPTIVKGGETLTLQWEETVNHPGKFIFSLSRLNDLGFSQNVLTTVVDNQNLANDLPHKYQAQVQLPDIDCPGCTLQMIQSMEENPASPIYYYSCADLNIQSTQSSGSGGGETTQNSNLPSPYQQSNEIKFSQGCGTLKGEQDPPIDLNILSFLLMLVPALGWASLRKYYLSATM